MNTSKLATVALEWRAQAAAHNVTDAWVFADNMANLVLAPDAPSEFAWLIERHDIAIEAGRPLWWCGGVRWSHDANDAIRFSRWQDGAAVACTLRCESTVTEHGWGAGPAGNIPPVAPVGGG